MPWKDRVPPLHVLEDVNPSGEGCAGPQALSRGAHRSAT